MIKMASFLKFIVIQLNHTCDGEEMFTNRSVKQEKLND
ncbi:hypothetical protein SD77_2437 [Bacillus badius]|uniref:Uncharacterized protein n=1 Tax=Bacillus badius TaxID=1455 RepID=A0ABR5B0C9_BACBA|nr:hypothetical protein SD78_2103 [Bacillus badius]KIL79983.1 hypothetical protein SD77_2437 [Bacillus badius]